MDIFAYAINIETEGEKFYRNLTESTKNAGIKKILTMLADDEVKHRKIFEKLRDNINIDFKATEIIANSKLIFKGLKSEDFVDQTDQIEVYRKAQTIEQKSIDFYREQAKASENKTISSVILKIFEEEKMHYLLLDNIIDLLMRPKQWVENAEFNKLMEEY
jgi:rubrerythrin